MCCLQLTNTEAKAAIERGDMIPDTVVRGLGLKACSGWLCVEEEIHAGSALVTHGCLHG